MTQEKKKEDMTLEELLESLPKLTPEQEAMLDEHGDWIETPENRKPSFTEQKTTSDTLSTQHIIPQSDEWHWLLPLFYSRSRPEKPSDTKSWVTTLSTRLRQWISLHF